jgi:catechol 2,3-dioxygenase-like lactoylglutathione lyase family enzyme
VNVIGSDHTGLHVADLDRSLSFYCGLLGFEVVWDRVTDADYVQELVGCPGAELHQTMLQIPGSGHRLELIDYRQIERRAVGGGPPNSGTAHLSLVVDDLRGLFTRLLNEGVEPVSEPIVVPSGPNKGCTAVYVIDPDGFRVELVQATAT